MENPPAYEFYDLETDPLEYHNLAGSLELAAAEAELKAALLAWRHETFDPLLDEAYLQRLMKHTDDHLARFAKEKEKALAAGTEAPYNRIDMTSFQEDWPTQWMR